MEKGISMSEHPSTLSSESTAGARSDEIDLLELCKILWGGKLLIGVVAVAFAVVAATYALTAQERWTAKAVIKLPSLSDYYAYTKSVKELEFLLPGNEQEFLLPGLVVAESEFHRFHDPRFLRAEFLRVFNLGATKKQFLLNGEDASKHEDMGAQNSKVGVWSGSISANLINKKVPEGLAVLSYQSSGAEESALYLQEYIDFSLARTRSMLLEDLQAERKPQIAFTQQELDRLVYTAEQHVALEIQRYQSALRIASSASLEFPLQNQQSKDYLPIQLGSKAIKARIVELENLVNLGIIDPRITALENNLAKLKAFQVDPSLQFSVFSYVSQVEPSSSRDAPKPLLLVVMGLLLGGVLGVLFVFLRSPKCSD